MSVSRDNSPIGQAEEVFARWLTDRYDMDILRAVLAAAAVERLDGDPAWLLVLGSPGSGKTETIGALGYIDESAPVDLIRGPKRYAHMVSSFTGEAALLSGSSQKDRAKDATGGLLRQIGSAGVLGLKDVTSILSARPDRRAEIMAALREVYDGSWTRTIGADGGKSMEWQGRIVVIGAVTNAWDRAHSAIASMGDRFVLIRLPGEDGVPGLREHLARQAMRNAGSEKQMRQELGEAACAVLDQVDTSAGPALKAFGAEEDAILKAALLTTWLRTFVEFDYRGTSALSADQVEAATRFAKQLGQMFRGALAIGMDRPEALRLTLRIARDSAPPDRLAVLEDVAGHPGSRTADVQKRLDIPWDAADKALQACHLLRLMSQSQPDPLKQSKRWAYRVRDGVDVERLNIEAATEKARPEQESNRWRDLFRGNIPSRGLRVNKLDGFSSSEEENFPSDAQCGGRDISPESAALPPQVHVFHRFAAWLTVKADGADARACAGVMVSDGRQPLELWETGFFGYDFDTNRAESWFADLGLIYMERDEDWGDWVELTDTGRQALAVCESVIDAEARRKAKPALLPRLRRRPPAIDAAIESLEAARIDLANTGPRTPKVVRDRAEAEYSRWDAELDRLHQRDCAEAEKHWVELESAEEFWAVVNAGYWTSTAG